VQKCGEVSDTQRPTVEVTEPRDVIDRSKRLLSLVVLRLGRIEAGGQHLQDIGPCALAVLYCRRNRSDDLIGVRVERRMARHPETAAKTPLLAVTEATFGPHVLASPLPVLALFGTQVSAIAIIRRLARHAIARALDAAAPAHSG
jgi:hypothetical protein